MSLSLKDRFKALVRALKVLANPKTTYINLFWEEGKESDLEGKAPVYTHTFYEDGINPVEPLLLYMGNVAGSSNTIEDLNKRAEFFLSKVAVGYKLTHDLGGKEIRFMAQPIRLFTQEELKGNTEE